MRSRYGFLSEGAQSHGGSNMSDIIERSAYFSLCEECKRHGCIVCADGTKSTEFGSISQGMEEVASLMFSGKIAEDEALEVRRQIETSGLQLEDTELEELLERFQGMKEELRELFRGIHRELRDASAGTETRDKPREKRTLH